MHVTTKLLTSVLQMRDQICDYLIPNTTLTAPNAMHPTGVTTAEEIVEAGNIAPLANMGLQVRHELLRKLQVWMERSVPVPLLSTHINHWVATVPDRD